MLFVGKGGRFDDSLDFGAAVLVIYEFYGGSFRSLSIRNCCLVPLCCGRLQKRGVQKAKQAVLNTTESNARDFLTDSR